MYVDLFPFSILLRLLIYTWCPHWGKVHIVTFIFLFLYACICVWVRFIYLLFMLSSKSIISKTLSCWTRVLMAYAVFCITEFLVFNKYGNFRAIAFVINLLKSLFYSRHQLVYALDQHCLWLHLHFPIVFPFIILVYFHIHAFTFNNSVFPSVWCAVNFTLCNFPIWFNCF